MKKRIVISLLCAALLTTLIPATALAGETPYRTYTDDYWGNAAPAPNGYIPTRSVGGDQLNCGSFKNPRDLFYCPARDRIYLADSGNARVVILSKKLEYLGEISTLVTEEGEEPLVTPQGVYVLDDGTMYIADTGAQRVVVCDEQGHLLTILPTPESQLLPEGFIYKPTKVVVDGQDRIYILSEGIYQGILYLDPEGNFIRFFGPNEVEMTLFRRIQKIWKSILPEKAAASMQSFNPIEYNNIFLSDDGYIYATAAGSENGSNVFTKLNPVGIDVSQWKTSGELLLADICADSNGIVTDLDQVNGQIYQFNESGMNMFTFGGIGDQLGLFRNAVSLIEAGEELMVLDADKGTITEFSMTEFGRLVHEATALYNDGLYEESIGPWLEVARHNANYLMAYVGLGMAYYQMKDYDAAMYYFKLGGSRGNYSTAFREASLESARASFPIVALILMAVLIALLVLRHIRRKRRNVPNE